MHYTWQQIQQMYPDQWVLMKGIRYSNGNISSAEEVIPYDNSQTINQFGENSKIYCSYTGVFYRGEPLDFCGYNEPVDYKSIEDEEIEEFADVF